MKKKIKSVHILVTESLHLKLKIYSAKNQISIQTIGTKAIEKLLESNA